MIRIGVAVLVVDQFQRILLRRSANGDWEAPIGYKKKMEYIEDTARREVLEQTGLIIGKLSLMGILPEETGSNAVPAYYPTAAFLTKDITGMGKVNDVVSHKIRFFKTTELPKNLNPRIRIFLENYFEEFSRK